MYPVETIRIICSALSKLGIENQLMQAGILAVITTEGSFTPKSEMSYAKTPNDRLRLLFGKRLEKIDEAALLTLKNNDVAFFDAVYGGQEGNLAIGDGWKYRGRGFNQITFRNNYEKAGIRAGVDLVTSPDRMNEPEIAAVALAGFFADGLAIGQKSGLLAKKYPGMDPHNPKGLDEANRVAFQINAGWGRNIDRGWFVEERARQMKNISDLNVIIKTLIS